MCSALGERACTQRPSRSAGLCPTDHHRPPAGDSLRSRSSIFWPHAGEVLMRSRFDAGSGLMRSRFDAVAVCAGKV